MDGSIKRVPLDRLASSLTDEMLNLGAGHPHRGLSSSHVDDLFFDDCSIQVVGSKIEADLSGLSTNHDPVSLDVREVVQHKPGDRNRSQVQQAGGPWKMTERRVGGVEC